MPTLIRIYNRYGCTFQASIEELGAKRKRIFDDGENYLLDLTLTR